LIDVLPANNIITLATTMKGAGMTELSDEIPEDVLEELKEASKEIEEEITHKYKKKSKYPSTRDLAEIVAKAAKLYASINPEEFPDMVRKMLEDEGYNTKFVTDKRIWRTYETLVRRGVIPDTLGVVMW